MNLVQVKPLDILQSASESSSDRSYRTDSTYSGCDRCAAHSQETEKKRGKLVCQMNANTPRNTLKKLTSFNKLSFRFPFLHTPCFTPSICYWYHNLQKNRFVVFVQLQHLMLCICIVKILYSM